MRPHGLYSPWISLGQNTGVGTRKSRELTTSTLPNAASPPRFSLLQLTAHCSRPCPRRENKATGRNSKKTASHNAPQRPCRRRLWPSLWWLGACVPSPPYWAVQGIFPMQGSNPRTLPHCRWILYQLSHQGSLATHIFCPRKGNQRKDLYKARSLLLLFTLCPEEREWLTQVNW